MFAQLGNNIFNGVNSFVSFSDDEEVMIVEHPLISRPATLQATAIGLRSLNLTLFLYQEFCDVKSVYTSLQASINSFEILPLLWGNGQVEGEFVITSMGRELQIMDNEGNVIGAKISISLKQNITSDRLSQQQQQSKANATAVGDKRPPVKSTRVNPKTCPRQVSDTITVIKANAGKVDEYARKYTNDPFINLRIRGHLTTMQFQTQLLLDSSAKAGSCLNSAPTFADKARGLKLVISQMLVHLEYNITGYANPVFVPDIANIKSDNELLQTQVRVVTSSVTPIIKSAIVNK